MDKTNETRKIAQKKYYEKIKNTEEYKNKIKMKSVVYRREVLGEPLEVQKRGRKVAVVGLSSDELFLIAQKKYYENNKDVFLLKSKKQNDLIKSDDELYKKKQEYNRLYYQKRKDNKILI
jgi:hypothetical protein